MNYCVLAGAIKTVGKILFFKLKNFPCVQHKIELDDIFIGSAMKIIEFNTNIEYMKHAVFSDWKTMFYDFIMFS